MVIQIDKYFFLVKHNVEGLSKSLNINLNKTDTLTKPVFTHIGGHSEEISFKAKILLKDIKFFIGFESLVKQAKPLLISSFDMVIFKHIFITSYTQEVGNFVKGTFNSTLYYTKDLTIIGTILEDYDPDFKDFGVLGLLL